MRYKNKKHRYIEIQFDIDIENAEQETEDLLSMIPWCNPIKPWREVDNREKYIKKRMKLEALN